MKAKHNSFKRGGCLGFLIKLLLLIVILLGAALYFAGSYIVSFTVSNGARMLGIDAGLKSFVLNPFSQVVSVGDFYVRNPEGFSSGDMLSAKKLYIDLDFNPYQFMNDNVVAVDDIDVEGMDIMLEIKGDSKGGVFGSILNAPKTNLNALQDKLKTSKQGEADYKKVDSSGAEKKPLKLIVRDFKFKSCKVTMNIDGSKINLVLPDFELKNLGVEQNGITVTQLSLEVVNALTTRAIALYVKTAAEGAAKGAGDAVNTGTDAAGGAAEGAIKSLKSLFN